MKRGTLRLVDAARRPMPGMEPGPADVARWLDEHPELADGLILLLLPRIRDSRVVGGWSSDLDRDERAQVSGLRLAGVTIAVGGGWAWYLIGTSTGGHAVTRELARMAADAALTERGWVLR